MKEEYQKPAVISTGNIEGVIPAGLPAAIAAFTAGVASGVAVKKMLNGRAVLHKNLQVVEVGATV